MKKLIAALLLAALAMPAFAELAVRDAWIRLPPPGTRTAAGYVVLENTGAATLEIIGADSEVFGSIMLHETRIDEEGRARMHHLDAVTIAPGSIYRFAPNGPHLMLFDPEAPLAEGQEIQIHLQTAAGESLPVRFTVQRR